MVYDFKLRDCRKVVDPATKNAVISAEAPKFTGHFPFV